MAAERIILFWRKCPNLALLNFTHRLRSICRGGMDLNFKPAYFDALLALPRDNMV